MAKKPTKRQRVISARSKRRTAMIKHARGGGAKQKPKTHENAEL